MATAQKGKKKPATRSAGTKKRQEELRKMQLHREIWGGVLIACAITCGVSWLPVDGFILKWIDKIFSATIGAGFFLLPFCLLGAGMLLIIKKRGKARLRVTCIMLLPVFLGAIFHIFLYKEIFSFTADGIKALTAAGIAHTSGGVVAGPLAMGLSAAFSDVGAIILLIAFMIGGLMIAFNTSASGMVEKFKSLPPEEIEPPRSVVPPKQAPQQTELTSRVAPRQPILAGLFTKKRKADAIDIPLDDAPAKALAQSEKIQLAPPNVLTPAQIMGVNMQQATPAYTVAEPVKTNAAPEPTMSGSNGGHEPFISPAVMRAQAFAEKQARQAREEAQRCALEATAAQTAVTAPEAADGTVTSDYAEYAGMHAPTEDQIPHDEQDIAAPWDDETVKDEAAAQIAKSIEKQLSPGEHGDTYLYPPLCLLKAGEGASTDFEGELSQNSTRLIDTLKSFGIDATLIDITRGPTVTRYEVQLGRGTKFSRITNLSDDIALSLGTASVRIATIPDKLAIGIEVPNALVQVVTIRDILDTSEFKNSRSRISFSVGKDITGKNIVGDIKKMPHMLIAGTTGSGKSVCINSLLISLIYKSTPQEVRLIMVDPKMIELGVYNGIPHLLIPVVTDPRKASGALNWAVSEMMRRYKLFSECNVRDLEAYNNEMDKKEDGEKLPQIVIVIDELADLMFVAAGEVENAIVRIAQMARAAGMHLIIATQRPSADVITGIMKANIPSRISFAVASQIESRIILDTTGAEKLLGRGDMLYNPLGAPKPLRVQGCFITTEEIEAVVEFVKKTGKPDYSEEVMEHIEKQAESGEKGGSGAEKGGNSASADDEMLPRAIEVVIESGQASVSQLQRRLKLGYSRAARLMDEMEERGIVGPFEGSKPRQITITRDEWQQMVMRQNDM